jgi:hypothetical protein
MKIIHSIPSHEEHVIARELKVKEVPPTAARFGLSQSAPSVMVVSGLGTWLFDQNDTDVLVQELRDIADMINRGVAR